MYNKTKMRWIAWWLPGVIFFIAVVAFCTTSGGGNTISRASIKGLSCIVDINDAKELGVNYCTENFSIGDLIDWSNPDPAVYVIVDGQKIGIKQQYVQSLDKRLKTLTDGGIKVMLVLLNQLPAVADPNNPLVHPDTDIKNAPYGLGAFNVKTAQGLACYRAAIEFLADRYGRPDKKFGCIAGMIIGNELQVHWEYYNLGKADMAKVIESYAPAVRYAHAAARKYSRDIHIYISLTNTWMLNNDDPEMTFAGRPFVERFNEVIRAGGDFDWGVAFHPYPDRLSDPRFWLDKNAMMDFNSPKITFKNIEILPAFLKQKPYLYNGKIRKLILSEQGFNTPNTPDGEKIQAAAYACAYYKISRIPEISAFILHRHVDHPHELNLKLGVWTYDPNSAAPAETPLRKKYIWQVFKEADGPNWRQAFEFALPIIGIKTWDEAMPAKCTKDN